MASVIDAIIAAMARHSGESVADFSAAQLGAWRCEARDLLRVARFYELRPGDAIAWTEANRHGGAYALRGVVVERSTVGDDDVVIACDERGTTVVVRVENAPRRQ